MTDELREFHRHPLTQRLNRELLDCFERNARKKQMPAISMHIATLTQEQESRLWLICKLFDLCRSGK